MFVRVPAYSGVYSGPKHTPYWHFPIVGPIVDQACSYEVCMKVRAEETQKGGY